MNKAVNSLCGILEGVVADGELQPTERTAVLEWVEAQHDVAELPPFSELVPRVREIVTAAGDVHGTAELLADVSWLVHRLRDDDLARYVGDVDALQGLLGGVSMDGILVDAELEVVRDWLEHHSHLASTWPFDEVHSMLVAAGQDGRIDSEEREALRGFFNQFTRTASHRAVDPRLTEVATSLGGVCAVDPTVTFAGRQFCFTGAFVGLERSELHAIVVHLGGSASERVTKSCDYLVVGSDGNPCWVHACYGRKVEQAVMLRRSGVPVVLVHERDFLDALAGAGLERASFGRLLTLPD